MALRDLDRIGFDLGCDTTPERRGLCRFRRVVKSRATVKGGVAMPIGPTNRGAVIGRLVQDVTGLSFRGATPQGVLADTVRDAIVEVIMGRTALDQKQPDGGDLAPLKPATIARKRRRGYPDTILVETGKMLAQDELRGDLDVDDHDMTITYGKSGDTREKAEWAHEGSGNRPPRPFFAIGDDPADRDVVDKVVAEGLDAQARARWGSSQSTGG